MAALKPLKFMDDHVAFLKERWDMMMYRLCSNSPFEITTGEASKEGGEYYAKAEWNRRSQSYGVFEYSKVGQYGPVSHFRRSKTIEPVASLSKAISLLHEWTLRAEEQGYDFSEVPTVGSGTHYRSIAVAENLDLETIN